MTQEQRLSPKRKLHEDAPSPAKRMRLPKESRMQFSQKERFQHSIVSLLNNRTVLLDSNVNVVHSISEQNTDHNESSAKRRSNFPPHSAQTESRCSTLKSASTFDRDDPYTPSTGDQEHFSAQNKLDTVVRTPGGGQAQSSQSVHVEPFSSMPSSSAINAEQDTQQEISSEVVANTALDSSEIDLFGPQTASQSPALTSREGLSTPMTNSEHYLDTNQVSSQGIDPAVVTNENQLGIPTPARKMPQTELGDGGMHRTSSAASRSTDAISNVNKQEHP